MLLKGNPGSKASALRRLVAEKTVAMPGAFNAVVAMMAEHTGFEAVYISGAGLVNGTAGYPDVGLLGMDEMAREAGYIANAVKVPCICDADTGFGETWQVMRTVRTYEREGLAGLHLEDQVMPKRCGHLDGKSLIGIEAMERKIAAACAARQDPDFMIIARCDARAVEGFQESVERGQRYLAAGADAIFAEAMQSRDEFARYAEEVKGPLLANMTEFGKSPYLTVDEFSELGYNMVIFPMSAFRAMMKTVEALFRELREKGTLESALPRMQTREELYQLLDYDGYTQLDAELAARFPERDSQ
jgi:methylisocitrate lyase